MVIKGRLSFGLNFKFHSDLDFGDSKILTFSSIYKQLIRVWHHKYLSSSVAIPLLYKFLDHIKDHLNRSATSANEGQWSGAAIKSTRRLRSTIPFDFKSGSIFCGIACDVNTDDKHPISAQKRKGCYHRPQIEEKERDQSKKSY